MTRIHITSSRDYDVCIGASLDELGPLAAGIIAPGTAVIVSDNGVFPLYGRRTEQSLIAAGFRVCSFVLPQGETSKNLTQYGRLAEFLCREHISRDDCIIALGGGMAGDLAGFAAATYRRGVACLQVPTSLLAMVDSSVGGKTGIDLPGGKNCLGCFYPAFLVLCDPSLLKTLPPREYKSACGEIIKYAMLSGGDFLRALDRPVEEQYEDIIPRCISLKAEYVRADEFDRGARQLLNFGHSVGHAVEAYSGYSIPHGAAVALGMAVITRAAAKRGLCAPDCAEALTDTLRRYELPAESGIPAEALIPYMLSDKKIRDGHLNLIVPRAVGHCEILRVKTDELGQWLREGGLP